MQKYEVQKTIEEFYIANVVPLLPAETKTFFDNQTGNGDAAALWLRHSVQETGSGFSALGNKETRSDGLLSIQIFTKKGTGSQLANQTADLLDIYTGARTGCVHFSVPTVGFSGVIGAWYQTTIYISFYSDEKRSSQ